MILQVVHATEDSHSVSDCADSSEGAEHNQCNQLLERLRPILWSVLCFRIVLR